MASDLSSNAIDVTTLVQEFAPGLLQQWGPARLFLVEIAGADAAAHSPARSDPAEAASVAGLRPAFGGLAPSALRRVRQYIEANLAEAVSLHQLAAIAALSTCHFSRAFKQSVGLPPMRFVMLRRVMKAMDLLRESDQSISEISHTVGFSDQSHFTRCFVAVARQTPRTFRRSFR